MNSAPSIACGPERKTEIAPTSKSTSTSPFSGQAATLRPPSSFRCRPFLSQWRLSSGEDPSLRLARLWIAIANGEPTELWTEALAPAKPHPAPHAAAIRAALTAAQTSGSSPWAGSPALAVPLAGLIWFQSIDTTQNMPPGFLVIVIAPTANAYRLG